MTDSTVPGSPDTTTTRQRILDAGLEHWCSSEPAELFGGFTVSAVAKAAGVTRATFYSYWSTPEEYLQSLLEHLGTRRPDQDAARRSDGERRRPGDEGRILKRFLDSCEIRLAETLVSPQVRVRLGFSSKLDDPVIAAGLRALYRDYEQDTRLLNEVASQQWGREPRPPFTDEWIQAILGALLDGIVVRHLVDPEAMPAESFGLASAILTMALTRPTDDPRDLDDILGAINQWGTTGARIAADRRVDDAASTALLSDPSLESIVTAARRLLADGSWDAIDIDDIALAVGIDADRLLRSFGSKTGLALAIVAKNADDQWREAARTSDPLDDLQVLLSIIMTELRRNPMIGQSVIQMLAGTIRLPDPAVFTRPPIPDIARLLAEAKHRGLILDTVDPESLSVSLTRIMLAEAAPATLTGANRADAIGYILDGIRSPA